MVNSVLTVCTGNICRSPVAEAALRLYLPGLTVSSAGLHAVVGRDTDADSAAAARHHGIEMQPHTARQFDDAIAREADVILVMESHHRREIGSRWPQVLGKTFLLGHFNDAREVPDPYRQPASMHVHAIGLIAQFCQSWAQNLERMRS